MLAQVFYLLLALAIAIVQKPSLVLRQQWIMPLSATRGIHWTGFALHSRSAGFLEPEIQLSWSHLDVSRPGLEASTGPGQVAIVLDLRHFPPRVSRLENVRIADVNAALSPSPGAATGISVPAWIRGAMIGKIEVEVASWRASGDHGSAVVMHLPAPASPSSGAAWLWELRASEAAHRARVSVEGRSASHTLYGPWELVLDARASGVSRQIREARVTECKLKLSGGTRLTLNCPLQLTSRLPRIKEVPKLHFADQVDAILTADMTSRDLLDMSQKVHLNGDIRIKPILPAGEARGVGRIVGGLHVAGDLVPSDPVEKWRVKSNLNLELRIDSFHRLVRFLDTTKYAIPAPFTALRGSVLIAAAGELSLNRAKIPLVFRTRLHSPNQSFDLDARGILQAPRLEPRIGVRPRAHLELVLTLTKIRIPLPHLDLGSVPQFLPDARITTAPPPRPGARQQAGRAPTPGQLLIDYHVVVKTTDEPIRIQTNLAKSLIPIRLNLALDSEKKPSGTVYVDSFPLDLFRRNAQVQFFKVDLTPKEREISGVIQVKYTDYTVYIRLFGSVDHPGYSFTSDPPLSDSNVVSVLLFGQTGNDLDSSQTQSVGSVRSAVAGRSLDLASMYLLASTPIENVGYDPESGTVTMRFRLASGTSLNLTEGQQQLQSVGIRHRLGTHWSITTQVGNPADPTDKSISALFQWSHRY